MTFLTMSDVIEGVIMINQELKDFLEKYKIEEKSFELFKENLEKSRIEYPEDFFQFSGEYDQKKVEAWIHSISYKAYNWPELDYILIEVEICIEYEEVYSGKYKLYYNLNGELDDTIFDLC